MALRYVAVAKIGEIPPGKSKRSSPERGEHVVVCNVGGTFYAVRDTCTHDGGILGFGVFEDNIIECPRHGAKFDVTTGEAVAPPAVRPIQTYPIRIQGEDILVGLGG